MFVDLNVDDVERVSLKTHASRLNELYLPKTALGVDFLVSMPKLKTHHWAGVTLSLKNMFGVVPGSCYGWPKNVLHWAGHRPGHPGRRRGRHDPDFAIVDGIVGMEGNGPIQGTPKASGVLVFGSDAVAVDATCCRVMGLRPDRIKYLISAGTMLGHINPDKIQQLGEPISSVRTPFSVLPAFQNHLGIATQFGRPTALLDLDWAKCLRMATPGGLCALRTLRRVCFIVGPLTDPSSMSQADISMSASPSPNTVSLGARPSVGVIERSPSSQYWNISSAARWVFSFPAMLAMFIVGRVFYEGRSFAVDPDLWWHIKVGQNILATRHWPTTDPFSFTVGGTPWIAYEWLGDVAIGAVAKLGGLLGLDIFLIVLASIVMLSLYGYATMRSGNSKAGFVAAGLLCSLAYASFNLRPQMFGYLFLILTLIALERFRQGKPKALWFLPLLFLVWINTHGSWIIGLGVIFVFWASGLWEFHLGSVSAKRWSFTERLRLELVFMLCLAAIPFTPYGTRLAAYPFTVASALPLNVGNILEWQPMPFNVAGGKLFLAGNPGVFPGADAVPYFMASRGSASVLRRDHDGLPARAISAALRSVLRAAVRHAAGAVDSALRRKKRSSHPERDPDGRGDRGDGSLFPDAGGHRENRVAEFSGRSGRIPAKASDARSDVQHLRLRRLLDLGYAGAKSLYRRPRRSL